MQKGDCMYQSTPFYIGDLSSSDFVILGVEIPWNQSSDIEDTEGHLKFWGSQKLHSGFRLSNCAEVCVPDLHVVQG